MVPPHMYPYLTGQPGVPPTIRKDSSTAQRMRDMASLGIPQIETLHGFRPSLEAFTQR